VGDERPQPEAEAQAAADEQDEHQSGCQGHSEGRGTPARGGPSSFTKQGSELGSEAGERAELAALLFIQGLQHAAFSRGEGSWAGSELSCAPHLERDLQEGAQISGMLGVASQAFLKGNLALLPCLRTRACLSCKRSGTGRQEERQALI
jgi:hypothetical protein